MPDEIPLEPRFVVCRCDHCRNGIEFDAVQLAGRAECRLPCPHCGKETSLREPPPPPALVPDEGWLEPVEKEVPPPAKVAKERPAAPPPPPPPPPPPVAPPPLPRPLPPVVPPGRITGDVSTTIFMPKPKVVSLPPDPLPSTHSRATADVRWLTDLGVVYFRQHQFGEALLCFRRAAEQGFATAQFCLAVCFFNGHGTAPDETAALSWLRQAAAQGDANAEFTLGLACSLGRGVPQDSAQAAEWLKKAAAHGHAGALRQLAEKAPPPARPAETSPREKGGEKGGEKRRHDLQRLVLGLFRKK